MAQEFTATVENWPDLHRLYMQIQHEVSKDGKLTLETAEAAGAQVGDLMDPPMNSAEFRRWDAQGMNARRWDKVKSRSAHPEESVSHNARTILGALNIQGSAPVDPATPGERALRLVKGMKRGEIRFCVCVSAEQAKDIHKRVSWAAIECGFKDKEVFGSILPNVVHQAEENRVLLSVMRKE